MKGDTTYRSRLVASSAPIGLLLASLGLCGHSALAQSAHTTQATMHMPQGAFLRQPSPNVASLVRQVKSDPKVAIRYARLFHLPVKMVPLALQQLHVKNLSADHVLQVHYVAADNSHGDKLVYKPRRVKKGTPVYCLPDGTPLLIRVCGNPIRSRVSPELYTAAPVPDFTPAEALIPTAADSAIAAAIPVGRSLTPSETILPVIPVVLAESVLAPTELPLLPPTLTAPELKAASLPPVYHWVHGGPGLAGLAGPLALLPLLALGGHSGSGASGLSIPIAPIIPGASSDITTPTTPGSEIVPGVPGETPGTPGNTSGVPVVSIPTPIGPAADVTPEPGSITLVLTVLTGAGWMVARKRLRK